MSDKPETEREHLPGFGPNAGNFVIPYLVFPVLLTSPVWMGVGIWYSITTHNAIRAECESIGAVSVEDRQCVMEDGTFIVPPSRVPERPEYEWIAP